MLGCSFWGRGRMGCFHSLTPGPPKVTRFEALGYKGGVLFIWPSVWEARGHSNCMPLPSGSIRKRCGPAALGLFSKKLPGCLSLGLKLKLFTGRRLSVDMNACQYENSCSGKIPHAATKAPGWLLNLSPICAASRRNILKTGELITLHVTKPSTTK